MRCECYFLEQKQQRYPIRRMDTENSYTLGARRVGHDSPTPSTWFPLQ